MARKRDNAPIKHTCPDIDHAQSIIDGWASDAAELADKMSLFSKDLEKLRTENEDLRTWGNEEYDRAEELEGQLKDANSNVNVLEATIHEMNTTISQLEDEIFELKQLTPTS